MSTTFQIQGRTVTTVLDVQGASVTIKSASFIPPADEYSYAELVLELLVEQTAADGDYLECDALLRDANDSIVGRFSFMEKVAAGRRCIISESRERFPDFVTLDIVGKVD